MFWGFLKSVCCRIYEGESNENLKLVIKNQNFAPLVVGKRAINSVQNGL